MGPRVFHDAVLPAGRLRRRAAKGASSPPSGTYGRNKCDSVSHNGVILNVVKDLRLSLGISGGITSELPTIHPEYERTAVVRLEKLSGLLAIGPRTDPSIEDD